MQVRIKKLDPDAVIPQYATAGAACFDLTSVGEPQAHPADMHAKVFGTGLAFEIPQDHVMLVFSRSGHGFGAGIRLSNAVGVIDAHYRGEVKVSLRTDAQTRIKPGRIAQAMILPVQQVSFLEADELDSTERGTGGLGSTGSKPLSDDADYGPWIKWAGGDEAPVAQGVQFQFRFRDAEPPVSGPYSDAPSWIWLNRGYDGDIVAYRVKKTA